MPADELAVRTPDGVVCVPGSIRFLSTYVLLEQEDWFEKEIGFVRRLAGPGTRAIDIGANYGVYTVALARAVGPSGTVWTFEPAPATAAFLRRTIARNGLGNVKLREAALSNRVGVASFCTEDNSELSRLADGTSERCVDVAVSMLDIEAGAPDWDAVDFVKLDAEGEEIRIIEGGARFFAEQSPIVMFEMKHGDALELGGAQALAARGYRLYRLLGSDGFLVPFDAAAIDEYDLNLFACKPERAAALAQRGLLADDTAAPGDLTGLGADVLARQPFAVAFGAWAPHDAAYAGGLDAYAFWREATHPPAARYSALMASLAAFRAAAGNRVARLSTLARAALDSGARRQAVDALWRILKLLESGPPALDEPFWPASARFDDLAPRGRPNEWFFAAAIEAYERARSFSGYFSPSPVVPLLDWLQQTPWASAAMERRRQLEALRAGRQRAPTGAPALAQRKPDNLNPELWGSGG